MLGHYASVYIKKLCDPILSQPDLAILHTDFNTVVTGILSENEEIDYEWLFCFFRVHSLV